MGKQETVSIALDLCPEARRVVVVCGSSQVDEASEALVRRLAEARSPGIEVLSLRGLALEEQLRRLSQLPRDSVVIFTGYRTDSQGRSMIPLDILRLVARSSSAPVFGASETYLGEGIVGGDLIRYRPLAEGAARLAARILRGESAAGRSRPSTVLQPADVRLARAAALGHPRVAAAEGQRRALPRAEPVGRALALDPAGLRRAGRPDRPHRRAPPLEQKRRVAAEAGLRDAEQRYRTVAEFTHDWEYWGRPDETFAYVSPSCLRVTGYTADDFYRRPALLNEIVAPEDRPRWLEHSRIALSETQATPPLEIRIVRADGEVRWIDHACTPVTGEDGRPAGLRGSNRDITDKKRSEEALRHALAEIERLRERLEADNTYLREQVEPEPGFEGIVGRSDALRYVLAKVQQVAPATTTVLLQGETGVGKDLFAHALHSLSPRRERPLVKLNCAALPPSLVESELFGHEKGSFTGATGLRKGRFEIADGSTLFLDEIGELPLELQAKLLRVIQDGEFERVGGTATLKVDVRLVAATNRRLDEEVKAGRFRQDLWYRLNVFPITVPPLRQRPRGRSPARPALRRQALPAPGPADARGLGRHPRRPGGPGVARQRPRARERHRAGGPLEPGARPPGGRPRRAPGAAARPGARAAARTRGRWRRTSATTSSRPSSAPSWRIAGEGGAAALLAINPSTLRSRMQKLGIVRPGSRPADAPGPT